MLDVGKKLVGFPDPLTGLQCHVISEFSQDHTTARSLEQYATTCILEVADLATDVRLDGLAICGYFGEATGLGHFQKELEVLDLHAFPLIFQIRHI